MTNDTLLGGIQKFTKIIVSPNGLGSLSMTGGGRFGPGKEPIPPGFFPDDLLFYFVTRAEGNVSVEWVTTIRGDVRATSCGINGWDLPGGIHVKEMANKIGLTQQEFDLTTVGSGPRTNVGRKADGGEITEGAAWGWWYPAIPRDPNHPYWQKFMPVYRDAMIWAWNQPDIQALKDPVERLCAMHSANWFAYHNVKLGLKELINGRGINNRRKQAREACNQYGITGMLA